MKQFQFFLLLALLMLPAQAQAQEVYNAHVTSRLISEIDTIHPGKSFWVAHKLKLDPKWHTYWKNPGDAGLATTAKWQLPRGFKAGPIHWPTPERISEPPIVIYGYSEEVYLLTEVTVPTTVKSGQMVVLQSEINYLVCEMICIPGKAKHTLRLLTSDAAAQRESENELLFEAIRSTLPLQETLLPLHSEVGSKYFSIEVGGNLSQLDDLKLTFLSDRANVIDMIAQQRTTRTDQGYKLQIPKSVNLFETPSHLTGVLVASRPIWGASDNQALEVNLALAQLSGGWQQALPAIPEPPLSLQWWIILGSLGLFFIISFFFLKNFSQRS